MPTTRLKEKLSILVSSQLPEHISTDYETFKIFLEYYYKFIEQDQGAQELLQNARSYADIDSTIDSFLQYFLDQYSLGLPKNVLADKRSFVKHARDLNKLKGSEEAYRLLFRILFDEEIDFIYPYESVLKPSDGKWTRDYIMRATAISGSPFDLEGTLISGNTSNSSAIVEAVISFQSLGDDIYEIYLNGDSIVGEFLPGENIRGIKLANTLSGSTTFVSANLLPIIRDIDVVASGLGYAAGQSITITGNTGRSATAIVNSVSDAGGIRDIRMTNFGLAYDIKPNVTIGAPTETKVGTYALLSNIATIRLSNNHSLVIGDNVVAKFTTGNVYNNSNITLTVTSIPNLKTFTADKIFGNANANGSVTITYTTNKFYTSRFLLEGNIVLVNTPIKHELVAGDNVNAIFNKTDVDLYTGIFQIINNTNVLVNFNETHNFVPGANVNVAFTSNYTNATSGVYIVNSPNSTANVVFTSPHNFVTGQNVSVNFQDTISNVVFGTFELVGNQVVVAFGGIPGPDITLQKSHPYRVGDVINVTYNTALTKNDTNKPQLAGNANIILNSNVINGNGTYFRSNVIVGDTITINYSNVFVVANIASNTIIYATANAQSNVGYANVYLVTSKLKNVTEIATVTSVPNTRRLIFSRTNADATGTITISNGYPNTLVNTTITAVVTSNGYPTFRSIGFSFANANTRGNVVISNKDVSNIINRHTTVLVQSVPTVRSIYVTANVASNIRNTSGNVVVTSILPDDIEDFAKTFTVLSVPHPRAFTFTSANANTRGNVTVYYSKSANLQANIGAVGIGQGRWIDNAGKLDEDFVIEGRIGTDNRVFYQPFSYVIRSSQPLSAWREAVKKLLHPAGFEVFGEVIIDTTLVGVQNVIVSPNFYPIKILGNVRADSTRITIDTLEYTVDNTVYIPI